MNIIFYIIYFVEQFCYSDSVKLAQCHNEVDFDLFNYFYND